MKLDLKRQNNSTMKLNSKNQVKTLLAIDGIKLKELSQMMTDKTGKTYTPDGLSHKLARGRLTYDEMLIISELLNYEIRFEKVK